MRTIKAYLDLCRVSNLPTIWTNVLAGSLLASGQFMPANFLLLALALSCFYMGGMSLNDVCDAEYDRQRRSSRPIPSGLVTIKAAQTFTMVLFACGLLLVGLAPNLRGVAGALLLVLAIVAYDFFHKDNPYSVLLMATCRFLVFVVVSLALTGRVSGLILVAGIAQFLYVIIISLVARHENTRSTPYPYPIVPAMLAGISLLDGVIMMLLISLPWMAAGMAGALLTWSSQRYVRGD